MRLESKIFGGIAVFLFAVSVVYGWWSGEVAGTACLVLSGGFALIIASYFGFVANRIGKRPEDRDDGEIAEGAGELGFFSPGSYWPLGLGLAAAWGGLALAFFQVWMIIVAAVIVLYMVGGLLFEYYSGQNETHTAGSAHQS